MTLVVETGAGVRGANSYVDAAFVTTYLTARNRQTENTWSTKTSAEQDGFCIAATSFLERVFGERIRGTRKFNLPEIDATGSITFTGLPTASETIQIGDQTYTFVSSLSDPAVLDEVAIGADAAGTASNLHDAITGNADGEGTTYATGTLVNRHASATLDGAVVRLTSAAPGVGGNSTVLSGSPTNVTLTAFSGGLDGGSQPLAMPRDSLYDAAGRLVEGVPLAFRHATAEYAVRAAGATLLPDPTLDTYGGTIAERRDKVGPIEEERVYVPGTQGTVLLRRYPEADRLITPFLRPSGVAVR